MMLDPEAILAEMSPEEREQIAKLSPEEQQKQQRSQLPPYDGDEGDADHDEDPLSSGVLPDALMTMRQKIESLTLFDSDMMRLVQKVSIRYCHEARSVSAASYTLFTSL